jgi:hypothetical protein
MRASGAEVKLEGSLDTFPLRELFEMTVYSSVTGALTIYNDGASGQVFFRDGMPYHATYDGERGEHAVVRMFEDHRGTFAFVADTTSDDDSLWHDPLDLVELCERLARRWARVRPEIPDMRLVPQLLHRPESDRITLDAEHWPVFSAIDGARSVEQIIEVVASDPLEVCEALMALQSGGLLKLAAAADAPRPPAGPARSQAQGGFFDRLLSTIPVPVVAPTQPVAAPKQPFVAPDDEDPILSLLRN